MSHAREEKESWASKMIPPSRQWPEVYDLCHTFLHVARVRKHTDMLELYAKRVQFSHASRDKAGGSLSN